MIRSLTVILIASSSACFRIAACLHKSPKPPRSRSSNCEGCTEFASRSARKRRRLLDFARSVNVPRPVSVRKPVHKRKRWVRPQISHVFMTPEVIGQDAPGA